MIDKFDTKKFKKRVAKIFGKDKWRYIVYDEFGYVVLDSYSWQKKKRKKSLD